MPRFGCGIRVKTPSAIPRTGHNFLSPVCRRRYFVAACNSFCANRYVVARHDASCQCRGKTKTTSRFLANVASFPGALQRSLTVDMYVERDTGFARRTRQRQLGSFLRFGRVGVATQWFLRDRRQTEQGCTRSSTRCADEKDFFEMVRAIWASLLIFFSAPCCRFRRWVRRLDSLRCPRRSPGK